MVKVYYLQLVLLFVTGTAIEGKEYIRWCYYTNWAQYRNPPGQYFPRDIDPFLCTHISYAFAALSGTNIKPYEWNDESTPWSKGMFERVLQSKKKNSNLKVFLAVGGWNMGSAPFTKMVETAGSRSAFISSCISFLRSHGFDGVDVDWEYPANRGSPPEDRGRFTDLLMELSREFYREASTTGNSRSQLQLVAAVSAGKSKIDTAYEIQEISKYLDYINIMTYDFNGAWDTVTGHNSPLVKRGNEVGEKIYWNLEDAATYWLGKGAPAHKINIGLSVYGRTFTLTDPSNNQVGSPVKGPGSGGPYTNSPGFLGHYEICDLIKNGAEQRWDDIQKVPYLVHNDQWISYDNLKSLYLKVQWIKKIGFAGVMIWSLPLDDFSGSCDGTKYPLIKGIVRSLTYGGSSIQVGLSTSEIPQPQVTSVSGRMRSPRPITVSSTFCQGRSSGPYSLPSTCSAYVYCSGGRPHLIFCTNGLYFNPASRACDIPINVPFCAAPTGVIPTEAELFCFGKPIGNYPDPTNCHKYFSCSSSRVSHASCEGTKVFISGGCTQLTSVYTC